MESSKWLHESVTALSHCNSLTEQNCSCPKWCAQRHPLNPWHKAKIHSYVIWDHFHISEQWSLYTLFLYFIHEDLNSKWLLWSLWILCIKHSVTYSFFVCPSYYRCISFSVSNIFILINKIKSKTWHKCFVFVFYHSNKHDYEKVSKSISNFLSISCHFKGHNFFSSWYNKVLKSGMQLNNVN